jgi:hypothetical protein
MKIAISSTGKNLESEVDLAKLEKAEDYLEKERAKLIKEKEKIRVKIRKEKEILMLENKIKRIKEKR